MKRILQKLVSFPTVSGNYMANNEALDYISDFLRTRGMIIQRHTFNNFGSLVATVHNTKTPKVMLAAHLDVVPGDVTLFKLREENGRLYGRGTYDMKFAIANYLQLIDDLKDELHHYDLGIMITTDEELAGNDGVAKLLEAGYRPRVFVLPDGGGDWAIETFAKGMLWARLTTQGKTAHGSRPWEGESAMTTMIDLLHHLQHDEFKDHGPTTNTLNIGLIEGGHAPNQIPDRVTAQLDIRTISQKDHTRIIGVLKHMAAVHHAALEILATSPPCITDVEHPLVKPFLESILAVTGQQPSTTTSYGASDARHIVPYGIPFIIVEPHGGGRHGPEEWIDAEGFAQFKDVVRGYVDKVACTATPAGQDAKLLTVEQ